MAWIELHQGIRNNKKTMRLAKLLNISKPQAVGHLAFLWLWAIDNTPDGNLSNLLNDEISEAAGWEGDPDTFVNALLQSGYVDKDTKELHDWFEYAGKLIVQRDIQREQTKERVKRYRERAKMAKANDCNADVTRYGNGDVTQCNADVTHLPNPTLPIQQDEEDTRAREEAKIFTFYQQNIGLISPHQTEVINSYLDDGLSSGLIIEIFKDSLGKSDKWSWAKKVMQNCIEHNILMVEQYNAKKVETKNEAERVKNRDSPGKKNQPFKPKEIYL